MIEPNCSALKLWVVAVSCCPDPHRRNGQGLRAGLEHPSLTTPCLQVPEAGADCGRRDRGGWPGPSGPAHQTQERPLRWQLGAPRSAGGGSGGPRLVRGGLVGPGHNPH